MTEFGIAGGVLGFWLLLLWRVRVERGWVGVSAALRLRLILDVRVFDVARQYAEQLNEAMRQLAELLTPAIREATAKIAAFADAWERSAISGDDA